MKSFAERIAEKRAKAEKAREEKKAKKFGNKPAICALGHSHRSKLEIAVCAIIQAREAAGDIKLLQVEDHIYLSDARIGYVADFKCQDIATGEIFWVEAKGFESPQWPIKLKLYRSYGPGRLEIWRGEWGNPTLTETVVPGLSICPNCRKMDT